MALKVEMSTDPNFTLSFVTMPRKHRVYHEEPIEVNQAFVLSKEKSHHLATVLRARPGDALALFDGSGAEFDAVIIDVDKRSVTVEAQAPHHPNVESPLSIHLLQGISRGERMDFAIQKAVELGVALVTPVITEYCGLRVDAKRLEKRLQHWRGIAINAAEQSGRVKVPTIGAPLSFEASLQQAEPNGVRYLCNPEARTGISGVTPPPTSTKKDVYLLIGPEGGLSMAEISQATAQGWQNLSLGPRVLRTETATIVAISLIQQLWGDLS